MYRIIAMLFLLVAAIVFPNASFLRNSVDMVSKQLPLEQISIPAKGGEGRQNAESLFDIPAYQDVPYAKINSNIPFFHGEENLPDGYEEYSPLDSLGRCGVAEANISRSIMPTGKREAIGMVKPSGWHTVRYDDIIDKKYLYNRCHLIGFQLAGENANERNLITGTRYLNVEGMLPFENEVASYVKRTGNHVRYRVTPIFHGDELVARGVLMEAESVEDEGRGVIFNVYCFNIQPGIEIDYRTGESRVSAGER